MKGFLRRRGPTTIAVALAFIAGGGVAVTAQTLITSADIKDGAVKTADLGNGAVNSPKIADGQVKRADLAGGAVNSAKIGDGTVKNADLNGGAVNSAKIANGGVANADLANNAVNSAKIANGGVVNADLANNAVNSAKIADGQVTSADIANGGVANADLANNAVNSAKVADGSITLADIQDAAEDALTAYSGANWGVVDRNVIDNGDASLRPGPVAAGIPAIPALAPPMGVGSLGIRTGAGTLDPSGGDKAAFGNQVDFVGMPLATVTAGSFWVFTTVENRAIDPANLPSLTFEINANLEGVGTDFTSMVYTPPAQAPGWHLHNAVATTTPNWFLTGAEGTAIGCALGVGKCTFSQVLDRLDDGGDAPVILTVQITKGRDHPFSGAVDALQINDTVYDFEPNGVFATPAP
jgi:hypothetical protein